MGVADTHTALWHLFDDVRLSPAAAEFIDQAAAVRSNIAVSAISLVEVVYLVEKKRLPRNAYADLKNALTDPGPVLQEVPFTGQIVDVLPEVPRDEVPDMPDRMIAATAVYLGVPVITRDGRIRATPWRTIW